MLQLIYASAATTRFSEGDLDSLLEQSRDKNVRRGVTGMLLYDAGSFLQVIEGPEDEIASLFANIEQDPRHGDLRVLSRKTVAEREFGDWCMAFARLQPAQGLDGYLDYDVAPEEQLGFDTTEADQLLSLFYDGLLRQSQSYAAGQVTVTIEARTPGARQRNYLLNLGRSLALAAPEIAVGVVTHEGQRINYNLHRDLEQGEAELF